MLLRLQRAIRRQERWIGLPTCVIGPLCIALCVLTFPSILHIQFVSNPTRTIVTAVPESGGQYRFVDSYDSNNVDGRAVRDFAVSVWCDATGILPVVNWPLFEQRVISVYEVGRISSAGLVGGSELSEGELWQGVVNAAIRSRPDAFFIHRFGEPAVGRTSTISVSSCKRILRLGLSILLLSIGLIAFYKSVMPSKSDLRDAAIQSGRCVKCDYCLDVSFAICPECGSQRPAISKESKMSVH